MTIPQVWVALGMDDDDLPIGPVEKTIKQKNADAMLNSVCADHRLDRQALMGVPFDQLKAWLIDQKPDLRIDDAVLKQTLKAYLAAPATVRAR